MRKASIIRKTKETEISCNIMLVGTGKNSISTGIGFFNHMLDQLAKHSLIDLNVNQSRDKKFKNS